MNKNNRRIFSFMVVMSIVLLCIAFTKKSFQNDVFYTIKVGESIIKNGIDMKDHFSWIGGLSYTYPHWLFDTFIYSIYNMFGFVGIYISTITLFIVLATIMYKTTASLVKNKGIAYILTVISILLLTNFIAARAQITSYILLLLALFFIEKLNETKNKKYGVGIIIISLLMANTHVAMWPFLFILFLPYFGSFIISKIMHRFKFNSDKLNEDKINIKPLLITFVISIFMGMLTPIGLVPYTYLFNATRGISLFYIGEHAPITIARHPIAYIALYLLVFYFLFSKAKINIKDLFMLAGLFFLSFSSYRHLALLIIIGVYSYARILTFNNKKDSEDKIINFFCYVTPLAVLITFILSMSYVVFKYNFSFPYVKESEYPIEAVKYIKKNIDIDNMRLFNNYNFGSYLMYEDIPVFIDSRAELYTDEFNKRDKEIFAEYVKALRTDHKEVFEYYNFTHLLLYKTSLGIDKIKLDSNYIIIYEDDVFALYEKVV